MEGCSSRRANAPTSYFNLLGEPFSTYQFKFF